VAGTFAYSPAAGDVLNAGAHSLTVTFHATDVNYEAATKTIALTVLPATPAIVWDCPGEHRLRDGARLRRAGSDFRCVGHVYVQPAQGTVLAAGAGQTLSVTFTPTDTTNYATRDEERADHGAEGHADHRAERRPV
jgi:hypothetical protein